MSRNRKRSQSEMKQQLIRPSGEQEKIDNALSLMATRVNRVLTERMVEMWHQDLAVYPADGIEWAFDSWGRNAKRLPVLSDITVLLASWQGAGVPKYGCEPECQELHGNGYGINDCKLLLKKRFADWERGVRWSKEDWDQALNEIDAQRAGGAPEWRQGESLFVDA